ncbi:MAG: hypothetical protein ACXW27_05985 [Allosphingosinicella sp.]
MSFLEDLLEGGAGYTVKMADGGASFRPAGESDTNLDAFQEVVSRIEDHEGEGYDIHIKHVTSERGKGLVDLVLIALAGEDD